MAQLTSITSLSDSEQFVVFENVFEYLSDIPTLASLTLANKRVRNAVYQWNGLRELNFENVFDTLKLNEIHISRENSQKKLKDGLRWLWTFGKRLNTIHLEPHLATPWFCDVVLPLLNSLVTTEKRRIKTIEICEMPCDWAIDLVRENSNTLRCLRVDLRWNQKSVSSFHSSLPNINNFWSVVQQCERLGSLDLFVFVPNSSILPELWDVLCKTPLKHLSLSTRCLADSEVKQKLVDALKCENLRKNLKSLTLDYDIFDYVISRLANEHCSTRSSVALTNVTTLTCSFLQICSVHYQVNWLVFWAVFPAVNHIKDNSSHWLSPWSFEIFLRNVSSFCKNYLEVSASHSRHIKIRKPLKHHFCTNPYELAALLTAATLPDDQDWCVSHGVQIETETRDEKVERVILRKDTSTLVFDFTLSE